MTIPIPLQEALRDSITSGTFVDTKFWVFSKRRSKPGRVGGPKALFVNEHVARRVPRLGTLLDERKIKENLRVRFPIEREPYTSNYEYEDDSDLEDDDYDDGASDSGDEPVAASQIAGGKSGNYSEHVTTEKSNTKGNSYQCSDITSVSEFDSPLSESSDTNFEADPAPSAHVGKVVTIDDVAFVTFQALLYYLYTNEIKFAPWGSAERRKTRAEVTLSESYGIPRPSPKSIYSLADKYDIPELKELALRQIQQDLSKCNITEEVFSKYTSWYPELRELELRQLARVLLSSDSGLAVKSFKQKVKCYVHGELPHGGHVISALYELMESDESVEETPITMVDQRIPNDVRTINQQPKKRGKKKNQQITGGDWTGLKKALTSSLTSGTFLDSQFYAVESGPFTGIPKIRPIYFCSTVGDDFMSKLMACSSKLGSRRVIFRRADGCDSDIEIEKPDQEDPTECYPRFKCVRENPTPMELPLDPALLLNHGAAKTWSAIFLYVYAGQITFAPIGSQRTSKGVQNGHLGGEPTRDREGLGAPPPGFIGIEPCSPKSIYCLANQVALTRLRVMAFKDIRSKLDENNIIEELFSPFTAEHEDIREMEHDLFWSKLKPSVDRTLLSNIIESSCSGEHSHRTATMELVLERSIQGRCERMSVKGASPPDPTPQHQSSEAIASQLPPPTPVSVSTPPLPSQSTSSPVVAPASAKTEASQGPSTLSELERETKTVQRMEPATSNTNVSPLEHTVELECIDCGAKVPQANTGGHIFCPRSSGWFHGFKCVGCGARRVRKADVCIGCQRKFV